MAYAHALRSRPSMSTTSYVVLVRLKKAGACTYRRILLWETGSLSRKQANNESVFLRRGLRNKADSEVKGVHGFLL
jgi:hypothetical protein